jgi:hypothetical protein
MPQVEDISKVQRLTRVDEVVATASDSIREIQITGNRAEPDERQTLELLGRSTNTVVAPESIERAGERSSFPIWAKT